MGRFVYWVEENGYFITFNWLEAGYLGQRLERVSNYFGPHFNLYQSLNRLPI